VRCSGIANKVSSSRGPVIEKGQASACVGAVCWACLLILPGGTFDQCLRRIAKTSGNFSTLIALYRNLFTLAWQPIGRSPGIAINSSLHTCSLVGVVCLELSRSRRVQRGRKAAIPLRDKLRPRHLSAAAAAEGPSET
jgi:hypothetical protein